MAGKELLHTLIKENLVLVLSKTYCPFCAKAKQIFKDMGVDAKIVELDEDENGDALQKAVMEEFSHKTVPAIWVRQNFIGGCDALVAARSNGELDKLLGK